MSELLGDHSDVEHIKFASDHLRGTIQQGLDDEATGAIASDDTQLTKFHGFYQQDDRDLRDERRRQKLEPHYQFMVRMRLPGGVLSPEQWLKVDEVAHSCANGALRLTTRQTFQFHGVLKHNLKPLMQGINSVGLDSRGGCGDDNRNVIANTNPDISALHTQVYDWAQAISRHLLWQSKAYDELWLDAQPSTDTAGEEPIYGKTYLPRKFKFGIAIPPLNDCDVFANDVGLIAITEGDELLGFNVAVGGGMGATYGAPETYPRLASVIGFCTPDQIIAVAENIVKIQRDYGDRHNRAHARFKYTIDDRGLDWVKSELNQRLGWALQAPREFHFDSNGDRYGWLEGDNGKWHLTLFVENGRIADVEGAPMMTGFRELAKAHQGEFRVTCNQNVIVANVAPENKDAIDAIVKKYGLRDGSKDSALRRASMACVAFPTCGLAMAESERYLPELITKLDEVMRDVGLGDDPIVVRMTGCPNGCARPYLGEIAFTGKAMGKYNVYLGASFNGDRMNKLYRENIGEAEILDELTPMIGRFAAERNDGEHFGDFVIRAGIIQPTTEGRLFHENVGPA